MISSLKWKTIKFDIWSFSGLSFKPIWPINYFNFKSISPHPKKLCQIFSDKIVLHFWLQLIFQNCSYTNWSKKHILNTHWIVLIFSNLKISLNFIRRLTSITQAILRSRFFDTKTFFRCNQCGFVDLN